MSPAKRLPRPPAPGRLVGGLAAGFAVSVGLRLALGGIGAARSPWGGLVFAGCLVALSAVAFPRVKVSRRIVGWGLLGAAVLCAPTVIVRAGAAQAHRPQGNFFIWALVVAVVALAEELFLRGTLFDAVSQWRGQTAAVVVGAVAFAALHVPLYGLGAVPLDLAAGVWLGAVRAAGGSVVSPALAHILADWAGWWLR